MSDFARRTFTRVELEALRNKPAKWVREHPLFRKYIGHPGSKYFHTENYLAVMKEALGFTFCQVLFDLNPEVVLPVVRDILDDHMQDSDLPPKDLQVNLVVNCVVRLVRAKGLLQVQRYGYGEDIVRKGQFPAEFKLALKEALFDRNAINLSSYVIVRTSTHTGVLTTWMR
jgi:hypothetical protein